MDKKNPGSFIKGVVDAGSKAVTGAINDMTLGTVLFVSFLCFEQCLD